VKKERQGGAEEKNTRKEGGRYLFEGTSYPARRFFKWKDQTAAISREEKTFLPVPRREHPPKECGAGSW